MSTRSETTGDARARSTVRWALRLSLALALPVFGAIFLAQLAVRFLSPSLFGWGSQFLALGHGVTSTVVLILSCLAVGAAGGVAAQGNRWVKIGALSATFVGGIVFLAVQSVEYENALRQGLGWGGPPSGSATGGAGEIGGVGPGDAGVGRGLWQATCRSCHGRAGGGVEGQGKDFRTSEFLRGLDDPGLLAFIGTGRPVSDPLNTTGQPMPPRGGNPLLTGPQLMDIVAYVRTIQIPIDDESATDPGDGETGDPPIDGGKVGAGVVDEGTPERGDEFGIPRSDAPRAALGPKGLSPDAFIPADRPARAGVFFGIYFLMTGVHVIQVLIGLAVLVFLIFRVVQIPYRPGHDVPVDLARQCWFLVASVWIAVFVVFYVT